MLTSLLRMSLLATLICRIGDVLDCRAELSVWGCCAGCFYGIFIVSSGMELVTSISRPGCEKRRYNP
jgi:hypothetical protein